MNYQGMDQIPVGNGEWPPKWAKPLVRFLAFSGAVTWATVGYYVVRVLWS